MKAKTILSSSDRFRRLPYLIGNLPSVIINTTHTLDPVGPHLSMPIHPHMQAHNVNIFFLKGTIRQVFHAYRNEKAIKQSGNQPTITVNCWRPKMV